MVGPLLVFLGCFFFWPLGKLVALSFPGWSPRVYISFFHSGPDTRSLTHTFLLSGLVTLIALFLGGFLAWELRIASRVERALILTCLAFPLWTSAVIRNFTLAIILGRYGPLNSALRWIGLVHGPSNILFTDKAVVIGMVYTILPFSVLPLYAAFLTIDLDLVRAARTLGASSIRAFVSVVVPIATPSFVASAVLVFVVSLGFYITPLVLGGASGSPFLSLRIADDVFSLFDLRQAAAASVILLGAALLCVGLTLRAVGADRLRRAVAP